MGDVSIPKPDPSAVGAKVAELIESGHALYATAVTGDKDGRVRRPTLFAVAAVGVIVAMFGGGVIGLIGGGVALIAMLLLAMTDNWGPI